MGARVLIATPTSKHGRALAREKPMNLEVGFLLGGATVNRVRQQDGGARYELLELRASGRRVPKSVGCRRPVSCLPSAATYPSAVFSKNVRFKEGAFTAKATECEEVPLFVASPARPSERFVTKRVRFTAS
jgi:hypothetical protein